MEKLLRWFEGYIHILLSGHQINRFLNLCSRNGIPIWHISHDIGCFIRVNLRLKDFYLLKPFLRKTKTHLKILKRRGFPFWCYRHPYLKWFPVFILCLSCLAIYGSTFIWQIRIQGNNVVSEQDLRDFLEEQEIAVGIKRSEIDCTQLEYNIRQNYEQLGWVSVYFDQTNLCIEVRESLYGEFQETADDNHRYDLIANKDAYIYSMITRSGTAVVTQGMHVRKGEVLVEGTCDIYDDNGEVQDTLLLRADALILGEVEYTFYEPLTEMEIISLKIAGTDTEEMLYRIGQLKLNHFVENLEENGVIILDKSVMIEEGDKSIIFYGKVLVREEIGTNILVEEETEHEFE